MRYLLFQKKKKKKVKFFVVNFSEKYYFYTMQYHPIIGIIIFLVAIFLAFLLGKNAFKKYKNKINTTNLEATKTRKKASSPPLGEITSPDAPWLKK